MEISKEALIDIIESAVSKALAEAGVSNEEICYTKAKQVYGIWFRDAVRDGRLKPITKGKGARAKTMYSISQIKALRSLDY